MRHTATPMPEHTPIGEDHHLWELEVQVESWMRERGLDKAQDQLTEARERRQMTRLEPVRHLMADWIEPVSEAWRDWRNEAARERGV